ncbi:MAG TPA: TetR/AcrR family transcriptional regulator [Bacteroidales bacterium]|nr:TetR/AcrR family transcriptional regulator [Bacteroidales bacterium]
MTDEQRLKTEEQIFAAAMEVFFEKGYYGARMQDISDKAGINKALLHYYYRSKDKMFEMVFSKTIDKFFENMAFTLSKDMSLFERIEVAVDNYISFFSDNPHIPVFVVQEINRDSEAFKKLMIDKIDMLRNNVMAPFVMSIQENIAKGVIRPIDFRHLIVNIVSMCIFPVIGKPLIQGVVFANNSGDWNLFIEERKKAVAEFVINAIKK